MLDHIIASREALVAGYVVVAISWFISMFSGVKHFRQLILTMLFGITLMLLQIGYALVK